MDRTRHAVRHVPLDHAVERALVVVERARAEPLADRHDVVHHVPAHHAARHVAVDRRAVVQHAHHVVDAVLLVEHVRAAADDARIGRVVDLVAAHLDVLPAHAQRAGRRILHTHVADAVRDHEQPLAVRAHAARADVVDVARRETGSDPADPHAHAAYVAHLEALRRALLRLDEQNGRRQVAAAEARAPVGRRRGLHREIRQRQAAHRALLRARHAHDRLQPRRHHERLRHVLPRLRPVDDLSARAVEIPLPRRRHPLARVVHLVLPAPASAHRPRGRLGEIHDVAREVVRRHGAERLRPHVVEADFGVAEVHRVRQVLRLVRHRHEFRVGGRTRPVARDARQERQIPRAEVVEAVRPAWEARARRKYAVHHERTEVPRAVLHLRQVHAPELVAVRTPSRQAAAAPDSRATRPRAAHGEP